MDALLEPGWGQGTFQDIAELRKALQTGYEVTIPSIAGGQALTVQSLDKTLKTITYTDRHLKFFKLLQACSYYLSTSLPKLVPAHTAILLAAIICAQRAYAYGTFFKYSVKK